MKKEYIKPVVAIEVMALGAIMDEMPIGSGSGSEEDVEPATKSMPPIYLYFDDEED